MLRIPFVSFRYLDWPGNTRQHTSLISRARQGGKLRPRIALVQRGQAWAELYLARKLWPAHSDEEVYIRGYVDRLGQLHDRLVRQLAYLGLVRLPRLRAPFVAGQILYRPGPKDFVMITSVTASGIWGLVTRRVDALGRRAVIYPLCLSSRCLHGNSFDGARVVSFVLESAESSMWSPTGAASDAFLRCLRELHYL